MFDLLHLNNLLAVILLVGLVGCNYSPPSSTISIASPSAPPVERTQGGSPIVTTAVTPSPTPARLLTICLGREPASLFYYDATSIAAQDVLAAVYDGPVDIRGYIPHPVILDKLPSLADRDAIIKPVEVSGGDLIVDSSGDLVTLEAGVTYRQVAARRQPVPKITRAMERSRWISWSCASSSCLASSGPMVPR